MGCRASGIRCRERLNSTGSNRWRPLGFVRSKWDKSYTRVGCYKWLIALARNGREQVITVLVPALEAHSLSIVDKTSIDEIEEVGYLFAARDALPDMLHLDVEVDISTSFGCTHEGRVREDWVIEMADLLAEAAADTIGHTDTKAYARSAQIKLMFCRPGREIGASKIAVLIYTTRAAKAAPMSWLPLSSM